VAAGPEAGVREIARAVGRSPSTVSRELRRNSPPSPRRYRAFQAHVQARERARRPRPRRLVKGSPLRAEVARLLSLDYSPGQVAGRLRLEHPGEAGMRVSHETIYQALFVQGKGGLRAEVAGAVRCGRAKRRWSRNGEASPWHGTPRHGPSTTTPPASSGATAPRSSRGSQPTSASYAGHGNRSKSTTSGHSKTSAARGRTPLNGSGGWQHAAARPSSSAAHATRASTAEAPHGNHDEHWRAEMLGKRASPVRREAVRKGPFRHLAGGPPYRTAGSVRGPGKRAGSNPGTAPRAYSAKITTLPHLAQHPSSPASPPRNSRKAESPARGSWVRR
jgi:hypothetical protein